MGPIERENMIRSLEGDFHPRKFEDIWLSTVWKMLEGRVGPHKRRLLVISGSADRQRTQSLGEQGVCGHLPVNSYHIHAPQIAIWVLAILGVQITTSGNRIASTVRWSALASRERIVGVVVIPHEGSE